MMSMKLHSDTGNTDNVMKKISVGDLVERRVIETIHSSHIEIPHPEQLTHLQFRRFAGCPMCNLHIHSLVQRHDELVALGIQEVAVFHSSKKAMLEHHAVAPFALIADPTKSLYAVFGVEASILSVLHPRSWLPIVRGLIRHGVSRPERGESPLGLPADFLIGKDGRVLACKYGSHAYDQWTVDELLELARNVDNAELQAMLLKPRAPELAR